MIAVGGDHPLIRLVSGGYCALEARWKPPDLGEPVSVRPASSAYGNGAEDAAKRMRTSEGL
jgi:hypothetical protein